MKYEGVYTDFGQVYCDKHDLVIEFRTNKKFNTLCCIEETEDAESTISLTFLELLREEFGVTAKEEEITDKYLSDLDKQFNMSDGYFKRLDRYFSRAENTAESERAYHRYV